MTATPTPPSDAAVAQYDRDLIARMLEDLMVGGDAYYRPDAVNIQIALLRAAENAELDAQRPTASAPKAEGDGVAGECVECGTDPETGDIRIIIRTTMEALRDGPPLVYRSVRVSLTPPPLTPLSWRWRALNRLDCDGVGDQPHPENPAGGE